MRTDLSLLTLAAAAALAPGCALVHRLGDYSFADDQDGEVVVADGGGPSSVPAADAEAPHVERCRSHRDCAPGVEGSPSVCVAAAGACAALAAPACPRVLGDAANENAIVLGAILGDPEGSDGAVLEAAAVLAIEEINAAGGLPARTGGAGARPLVLVGCNGGSAAIDAATHLVQKLHVAAIVGPTDGEKVIAATQQLSARGGTLLMTPSSSVSSISQLADEGLTWRARPSDAQRAKLVVEQIHDLEVLLKATRSLESVKLGVVHGTDARGTSAREAIAAQLVLNGRFITDAANERNVSLDAHRPGDTSVLAGVAARYATTFRPDIVFITAPEQVRDLVVPLEAALTAGRALSRPYYVVTDAAKTEALLDVVARGEVPPDMPRRIRGVGVKPDKLSAPVLAEFGASFAARYGSAPLPSLMSAAAAAYDATYSIAYAIAAMPDAPLSGASVAEGLRTLSVGEPAVVGARGARDATQRLASRTPISLRGTFGPMRWDASGDILGGTIEVWCLGTHNGAAAFGSSGLTMDVQTQVTGGAFVQCQ